MLRLIGSHYHFRRAVPVAVQARLGRTEISPSLQTQSKLVARERAAALYARNCQWEDSEKPFLPSALIAYGHAS